MTNSLPPPPPPEQRRAILLIEALGLIHDLGKMTDDFVRGHIDPAYPFQFDYNLLVDPAQVYQPPPSPLHKRITSRVRGWVGASSPSSAANPAQELVDYWRDVHTSPNRHAPFQIGADPTNASDPSPGDFTADLLAATFTDWNGEDYSLAELAPLAANRRKALKTLGLPDWPTEQEWYAACGKRMQPAELINRLHGIAHYERAAESKQQNPANHIFIASPFGAEQPLLIAGEKGLNARYTSCLRQLIGNLLQITGPERPTWLASVRDEMQNAVSQTQRPANEVSLWDWGYIVASLGKAAAAWIFAHGWPQDVKDIPVRSVAISLDRLQLIERSDKITDMLGLQGAIDTALLKVRRILEEDYALGNQFYADETGAYFLCADLPVLTDLAPILSACFDPDLCPRITLGDPIALGDLDRNSTHRLHAIASLLAQPRQNALADFQVHRHAHVDAPALETTWQPHLRPPNAASCTVCNVRPIGYPFDPTAPDADPAVHQFSAWVTDQKARDRNICQICIDRRGRRAQTWAKDEEFARTIWLDEVADDSGRLALIVGRFELEHWLDGEAFKTIFVTKSGNRTKLPSPVALYRVAETTRRFWDSINDDHAGKILGQSGLRFAIYPDEQTVHKLHRLAQENRGLGRYHAYELNVNAQPLSVLWDPVGERLITAENLRYRSRRLRDREFSDADFSKEFGSVTAQATEPSSFLRAGRPVLDFTTRADVERLDDYEPFIPLLATPTTYMAVVPADRAVAFARMTKSKYANEMGRVRDRLPLHVGIVFFSRRTPLSAVLDAGRRLLQVYQQNAWQDWPVEATAPPQSPTPAASQATQPSFVQLKFANGVTWKVPVTTGDPTVDDIYYPTLSMNSPESGNPSPLLVRTLLPKKQGRPPQSQQVYLRPGRFDFEYLDSTARRYEIDYIGGRRRPTRPFLLDDLDRLARLDLLLGHLTPTQIHALVQMVESIRYKWHEPFGRMQPHAGQSQVFAGFVRDALAGASWPQEQPWRSFSEQDQQTLVDAGLSGELADWLLLRSLTQKEWQPREE